MFSCLLLRSTKEKSKKDKICRDPISAKRVDLNLQAVAQVGCGEAKCSYSIEKDEECLVLYVPALLAHKGATRQHLKVTKCSVNITNTSTHETTSQTLELSRLNSKDYSKANLPTHSFTKELHTSTLALYSGAISADDLLLHIGELKADSVLEIELDFLVKFSLSPLTTNTESKSPLQYVFYNKLPSMHLNYSASLASSLPVEDVVPLLSPSTVDLKDFRWDHVTSSNVIRVQYECTPAHTTDDIPAQFMSGFSVELSAGNPSGCCSLTYAHSSLYNGGASSSKSPSKPGDNLACDGVMMLTNNLTPEQFPSSVQRVPLHPSEFVFVIDCSGSMSGSNIQAATDTLITCIKSLPAGSYFNVIAFGSNFKNLFHTSAEYSKRSVEKAIHFASTIQASLGGTELLGPLRWIFKKPRCDGLPRQIFIVTDGGVSNTQSVLHTVRKNRHQARCHTFGIGPDVCTELVTGIAAASGGRCVLLQEGERLQTKVMEVLRESLHPSISDSVLGWSPPSGYSIIDTTPKSLDTIYSGSTHTAFALLKQEAPLDVQSSVTRVCGGSVSISGQTGNEQVELNVDPVSLPHLTPTQSNELAVILDKMATWSKLQSLEMQLTSSSRKNSHEENDKLQEPEAKRIKLNGVNHSTANGTVEITDQLIELSLSSGIPCGLTCFRGEDTLLQLLPYQPPSSNHSANPAHVSKKMAVYQQQKRLAQLHRMQNRSKRKQEMLQKHSSQPLSVSSFAKSTLTAVGSTLKTVVSSFGLVLPETGELQNGHRIEDHLEFESQKKSSLHWDDDKGKLVYPSYYRQQSNPQMEQKSTPVYQHSYPLGLQARRVKGSLSSATSTDNSSDDEDFSISDTESDSSLDPDWDNLRRPSELRPLLQMQLYNGAWPMVRAFSYAVGVPLEEVRKLLEKETSLCKNPKHTSQVSKDDEDKANVWTTALALACLKEYFPHLRAEWEVVAMKGQLWLAENLSRETELSLSEVTMYAKQLVSKWV